MKRSRLRAGAYTTQSYFGPFTPTRLRRRIDTVSRTPCIRVSVFDKRFAPLPTRESRPGLSSPNRHVYGHRDKTNRNFSPQPHKQHARPLPTGTAHAGGRAHGVLRREKPRLHLPRARSPTNKFRNLRCDGTRRRGVQDGVQYGIRCTTAHVRYSVRHTVHDGTCSIQYGVQCATAHSSIQRTTRSTRIRK